jgi:uncharacterized protein (TIGR02246 family)
MNSEQEQEQEQEHEAVLATFKAMSDAWALMDAGRFAACYAADATVIGPGIYLRGRDDINASMAGAFTGPLKDSLRPHSAQSLRFVSGDTAVVVTESATVFPGESEVPPDRQHLVTWILTRHDGQWLVEANHICPA